MDPDHFDTASARLPGAWLRLSRKCARSVLSAVLLATLAATFACSRHAAEPQPDPHAATNRLNQELLAQLAAQESQERLLNETVWAPEILAQHQGQLFDSLWDAVNAATNKLAVLAAFPIGEIQLADWSLSSQLPHGIELRAAHVPGPTLSQTEWQARIHGLELDGWQLGEIELRHNRFEPDPDGHPKESVFFFAAHLTHPARELRAVIDGDLLVHWAAPDPAAEIAPVRRIDATRLGLRFRRGRPPFQVVFEDRVTPLRNSQSIDPVILYDLDRDRVSEIVLAARNLAYRRQPDADGYVALPLCLHPATVVYTAVIGDFNHDGMPDLLCASIEGLLLFAGTGQLPFNQPGQLAFPAPSGWHYPMALTAGDLDADGDLDLFLGQYRVPYESGSLPTPYYDANDGHPAYLLLNNGHGLFTDATSSANLQAKRWRRTYSASLADLDADGHLDLVVVSDFAGVDLYHNDGRGRFTDVTDTWVPDARAFGMAHALADFNADGRLDLLMIGMTSPTVDRLNHLGLWRSDVVEDRTMPARMMYGNRLLLALPTGGFSQTRLSDDVARSGWSWGCASFDFENDGFPDLYVANGLESRASVRDYESEYWLHDRFIAGSKPEPSAYLYFQSKFSRTRGRGHSYGGYERNRLYLNRRATAFLDVGHLMGLGHQEDARNVVADDLDGDGRVDLVTTSFEPWPASRQILRIHQNAIEHPGNWIGFRFQEEPGRPSPSGVSVSILSPERASIRHIVTGDSHRSQHSPTLHFGLGEDTRIDQAEIRWPGGIKTTLLNPSLNQYHQVLAPALVP